MSRIGRGPGAARRWATVGAVVALLAAAPAVADRLPVRDVRVEPRALLQRIVGSANVPYSGYAESASAIGLPDVPEVGRVVDLLGETSHLRVWYRTPTSWRVDTLTPTGERDTYGAGTSTWLWDSGQRRAIRVVGEPRVRLPRSADMLPPELGRRLARLVTPNDRVTGIHARRVAGVAAAGIRIEPADQRTTTVRCVDVWADPTTGLPLRVEVTPATDERPLVTTAFLELDRAMPATERVTFVPPLDGGVDVTTAGDLATRLDEQLDVPLPDEVAGLRKRATVARAAATYGEGFGVVAVIALPDGLAYRIAGRLVAPFAMVVEGTFGRATVLTTPLVNGVLVIDPSRGLGYAISGATPPETLLRVAAALVAG
jgi:hypothetical protein